MKRSVQIERWGLFDWKPKEAMKRNKPGATHHYEHLVYQEGYTGIPAFFRTRSAARKYASEKYGYIKTRKDLRVYPHFWRIPKPVKLMISVKIKGATQ
jgi:hypothetical protein